MTDEITQQELEQEIPQEAPQETEGSKQEMHVGPVELLGAAALFVVLVGGIGWSWYKGFQAGTEEGRSIAYKDIYPQLRKGAQAITRQERERQFFVVLQEGQEVSVLLKSTDKEPEAQNVKAKAGDRVMISVSPGNLVPPAEKTDTQDEPQDQ